MAPGVEEVPNEEWVRLRVWRERVVIERAGSGWSREMSKRAWKMHRSMVSGREWMNRACRGWVGGQGAEEAGTGLLGMAACSVGGVWWV